MEIDPFCCAVLESQGEVVLGRDICSFDATGLRGTVDVVVGGFPCQDVSVAGKRAGSGDGTRSGLWRHMLRVWDECGATWLFAENVRGLLSSDGGRDYAAILEALASRGADACWTVLRASDVGAPHRRERWFLLSRRPMGHADAAGREQQRGAVAASPQQQRAERGGGREVEPTLGGAIARLADRMDVWPVGRGAPQHPWEAPRTITGKEQGRIPRLKALGNGWVPQQAAAAFRYLMSQMEEEA